MGESKRYLPPLGEFCQYRTLLMKRSSPIGLLVPLAFTLASVQAQTQQGSDHALVRPRTVSSQPSGQRKPDSQTGGSAKVRPETGGTDSETGVLRQPVEASG